MLASVLISMLVARATGLSVSNDPYNHTFAIDASKPGLACAPGRQTMCCEELDYSGYQVQCIGRCSLRSV